MGSFSSASRNMREMGSSSSVSSSSSNSSPPPSSLSLPEEEEEWKPEELFSFFDLLLFFPSTVIFGPSPQIQSIPCATLHGRGVAQALGLAVAARATELETKEEQPDSCGIPVHFPSSP